MHSGVYLSQYSRVLDSGPVRFRQVQGVPVDTRLTERTRERDVSVILSLFPLRGTSHHQINFFSTSDIIRMIRALLFPPPHTAQPPAPRSGSHHTVLTSSKDVRFKPTGTFSRTGCQKKNNLDEPRPGARRSDHSGVEKITARERLATFFKKDIQQHYREAINRVDRR